MLRLKKRIALGIPKLPQMSRGMALVATLLFAFAVTTVVPVEAFAQRSRSSSPSRSKPSTSRNKTNQTQKKTNQGFTKKTDSANKSSDWGSNKKSSGTRTKMTKQEAAKKTAAEKALHDKAKQNGTHFKSRSEATTSFKQKHQADIDKSYPTKFDNKPTTRPDYIPQTTSVGGTTYNVTYNQQYGGYGYMGPSGWSVFDVMTVALVADAMMTRHNYAYGEPRVYQETTGVGTSVIVFTIISGFILGIIIIYVVCKKPG